MVSLPHIGPLAAGCYGLVAFVLAYDAKRAFWPRIPGEQIWRRGRVAGTTAALLALSVLQRASGPQWFKRVAIVAFILALAAVLRCSVPLKRMVAAAVRRRREGPEGAGAT